MDARAVLSAVEGVDDTAVTVGLPAKDTPSHTSFPARRVSGSWTKHARSRAAAAAVLQVLFGVALGAVVAIASRHHLRASVAGGSAETAVSAFAARPEDETRAQLRDTRLAVSRLLDVVDALRAETAKFKALARSEKCDAETLAPLCASARDDDRSISRRDAERLIEKERRRQKKDAKKEAKRLKKDAKKAKKEERRRRSRDSRSSEALARLAEVAAGRGFGRFENDEEDA